MTYLQRWEDPALFYLLDGSSTDFYVKAGPASSVVDGSDAVIFWARGTLVPGSSEPHPRWSPLNAGVESNPGWPGKSVELWVRRVSGSQSLTLGDNVYIGSIDFTVRVYPEVEELTAVRLSDGRFVVSMGNSSFSYLSDEEIRTTIWLLSNDFAVLDTYEINGTTATDPLFFSKGVLLTSDDKIARVGNEGTDYRLTLWSFTSDVISLDDTIGATSASGYNYPTGLGELDDGRIFVVWDIDSGSAEVDADAWVLYNRDPLAISDSGFFTTDVVNPAVRFTAAQDESAQRIAPVSGATNEWFGYGYLAEEPATSGDQYPRVFRFRWTGSGFETSASSTVPDPNGNVIRYNAGGDYSLYFLEYFTPIWPTWIQTLNDGRPVLTFRRLNRVAAYSYDTVTVVFSADLSSATILNTFSYEDGSPYEVEDLPADEYMDSMGVQPLIFGSGILYVSTGFFGNISPYDEYWGFLDWFRLSIPPLRQMQRDDTLSFRAGNARINTPGVGRATSVQESRAPRLEVKQYS